MAEKSEKKEKSEAPPSPKDATEKKEAMPKAAGGGMLSKTPVVLGMVMLLEAVVLFAGFKFLGGGPKHAVAVSLEAEKNSHGEKSEGRGETSHGGEKRDKKTAELAVVDFRAPNTMNGRRYIYDVNIFIVINAEHEQKVKDALKEREAMVKDRIRTIIAQMDPEKLGGGSEPGLETLRRQVKKQLEIILDYDMIHEVLVPRCIPFRADF